MANIDRTEFTRDKSIRDRWEIDIDEHDEINNAKRVNVVAGDITLNAGDIQVSDVQLRNVSGDEINPATLEKQDELISAIGNIQMDGSTQIKNSSNSLIDPSTSQKQDEIINAINSISTGNVNPSTTIIEGGSVLKTYLFHDLDEDISTTYVGYEDETGRWLVKKIIDTNGVLDMTYANVSNNVSYTTYQNSWDNRVSLVYEDISNLTFETSGTSESEYSVTSDFTILDGQSMYLLGVTNSKKVTFKDFNLTSSQDNISLEFFESATISLNGSLLTSYDLDREVNSSATMAVYGNPTVSNEGIKLMKHVMPNGGFFIGGSTNMPENWKLKSSTNYLVKVTNNSGFDANMTGNFYWKEK